MELKTTVSIPSPFKPYFHVSWEVVGATKAFSFCLPVWTPGSYTIRDFSQHLHRLIVKSESDSIPFEQVDLSEWRIPKPKSKMKIEYVVYSNDEYSVRTNMIDDSYAFVNPPALFLYPKNHLDLPMEIEWDFRHYRYIYSSLPKKDSRDRVFLSPNFDTLYDSPFHLSQKLPSRFLVSNCEYELLIEGMVSEEVKESLTIDLKRIVSAQSEWMGVNPNKYYLFILNLSRKSYGGLEHKSCSINHFDPEVISKEENYLGLLELLSHEHFHLWNVKRLRPRALGPFDYQKPNLTKELWVAEGITSFVDCYSLFLAGIIDRNGYINRIQEDIFLLDENPGDEWMSLEESSFTAWNKYYKRNPNSHNLSVSYYTKGFGFSLLLDIKIREATQGNKSIKDLMRFLYQKFVEKEDRGFTKTEFFEAVKVIANKDLYPKLKVYLEKRTKLPLVQELEKIGIVPSSGQVVSDPGFSIVERKGNCFVNKIWDQILDPKAEIFLDDEILAIQGKRIQAGQFQKRIKEFLPGERIRVLISHLGKTNEILLTMGKRTINKNLVLLDMEELQPSKSFLQESFFSRKI